MTIDDALMEKNRVQVQLSTSATDIHDYFVRSHEAAYQAMVEIGKTPNYVAMNKKEDQKEFCGNSEPAAQA